MARVETEKGEYLAAMVTHEGRATSDILAEIVPKVTAALRFPKMMRWGDGSHEFVRPVHGVVALLDSEVSFSVAAPDAYGYELAIKLETGSIPAEMSQAAFIIVPSGDSSRAVLSARRGTLEYPSKGAPEERSQD